MARHATSKRSHSAVAVTDQSCAQCQVDGSCFGKPDQPEPEKEQATPKMPEFLSLTNEETHEKYIELTRLENERLAVKDNDPSMDNQWARLDADPILDRYSNIHPWANRRIHLKVPEGVNDYINASPVSLISTSAKQSDLKRGIQDKYICMQGPKFETVDHTWHMLWHEFAEPYNTSPAVIIMLSALRGADPNKPGETMEKCYAYLPMDESSPNLVINETNQLGEGFRAIVKFESREPTPEGTTVEIRKLLMWVEGNEEEVKPIWHFLYPSWPDFGALEEENVTSILSLMSLTREMNGKQENPRLVHCSAGVGRTGTFVALEFLIGELQGGAWEGWDESEQAGRDAVFDTINQLREQRRTMVQAYEQYAFLYEVLRKLWEEKYGAPCIGGDHQHAGVTANPMPGGLRTKPVANACSEHASLGKMGANVCAEAHDGERQIASSDVCGLPGDDAKERAAAGGGCG